MFVDLRRSLMTIAGRPRYVGPIAVKSWQFELGRQNPGRVVTLVHKEDWDAFSGSVSVLLYRVAYRATH